MVDELDSLLGLVDIDCLEDEIDSSGGVDGSLLGGDLFLLEVGAPDDVPDGVSLEEVGTPVPEGLEVGLLVGEEGSVDVGSEVLGGGVLEGGILLSLVDEPVGVTVVVSDELSSLGDLELRV